MPAPSIHPNHPLAPAARGVYDAAVRAVSAEARVAAIGWTTCAPRPLAEYRRVVVVGAGKAALAMAGAFERATASVRPVGQELVGCVVVPHGYRMRVPPGVAVPERIEVLESGHPIPDAAGVDAARRALALARACVEGDLLVALISGGGSALWPLFVNGISLADARATFALLLASGADIHEINTVRKQLTLIGGGRLAAAAFPADVCALVLSDVPGDDLSVIASGPTVPDLTTCADATAAVRARQLWQRIPTSVRSHLERGSQAESLEVVRPGAPWLARTRTVLVGSNRDALAAARMDAEQRGFAARIVTDRMTGEARDVGIDVAHAALGMGLDVGSSRPTCLLWGGETTVTVRGMGRGGRNQEVALAAALELDRHAGRDVSDRAASLVILSAGTDGIDGPTDAAGACVGFATIAAARARGIDPRARLVDNDAYPVLDAVGALLRPGPSHTNVMDIVVALIDPITRWRRGA